MPKRGREINEAKSIGFVRAKNTCPLPSRCGRPYIAVMNYILAILLPPLSILLTGRLILSILVFLIWVPALIFSGGLTHPMFILLAWFLIFSSRERAARAQDLRARR